MKFCPECGSIIENKTKCECGYEVSTGKVNKEVREKKEKELSKYNPSNDNILGNIFIDNNYKGGIIDFNYLISSFINGLNKNDIEDSIYNFYNASTISKDLIIKRLEEIRSMELDKHIDNVLKKIKNN